MALILIIIILIVMRMYLLTNVITMLMIPKQQALSPFQLPCSEFANAHFNKQKMICLENNNNNINNNNYDEDFANFATCRFSNLKVSSNCLEDIVSHKHTRYQKVCVY